MMILPENILSKMSPEDRAKLGRAGITASEATEQAVQRCERDLHDLISAELNRRGIWFTRSRMDRKATNTVGTPDFVGCLPTGRFLAIEAKHGTRKTTPEQERALADIRALGGAAGVVRTFDEFRAFLLSTLHPE